MLLLYTCMCCLYVTECHQQRLTKGNMYKHYMGSTCTQQHVLSETTLRYSQIQLYNKRLFRAIVVPVVNGEENNIYHRRLVLDII